MASTQTAPGVGPSPAILVISALRTLTGVACFLAPQPAMHLMGLDVQAATNTIMPRIFGAREIGIGVVTYLAYRAVATPVVSSSKAASEKKIREEENRATLAKVLLWGNVLVDGGDAIACLLAWLTGAEGEVATATSMGPMAVLATVGGLFGLRSVY